MRQPRPGRTAPDGGTAPERRKPPGPGGSSGFRKGCYEGPVPAVKTRLQVLSHFPRPPGDDGYLRVLTARPARSATVSRDASACSSISSLVRRVSGMASVGLKAVAFVNDT